MQILVLSSIYPGAGTPLTFTPVVHYFVREWVKLGYDVRVIHTSTYFPCIYYKAPNWVRRIVQAKIGIALPEARLNNELEYEYEGVQVYRIPMKKIVPMGGYSVKELDKACWKAEEYIRKENFKPQFIISHWLNPQLLVMSYLKKRTGATTALVLHGMESGISKLFQNWEGLVADVDIWGYRSINTKESFESIYGHKKYSFRCYSGIPEYYTSNVPLRDGKFYNRFVQVGLLIERKYPDKTIDALASTYQKEPFRFNLIGEGEMRRSLIMKIHNLGMQDSISLLGRLPRHDIIPILDSSDVFILISKNEVFGLVYIEAMARGCIVIASRGEGMEGVIQHGVNGFLCEAGNANELSSIIEMIRRMSDVERKQISDAAIRTSLLMTDVAVAKEYITKIIGYGDEINASS